jgi:putative ABC transport system permease protein
VRQVVGESLVQGIVGGLAGLAVGVAAAVFDAFGYKLSASSTSGGSAANLLGLGSATLRTAKQTIALHAPLVLLGIALAIVGGLLAGAAGGLRAARLRPADALRRVE